MDPVQQFISQYHDKLYNMYDLLEASQIEHWLVILKEYSRRKISLPITKYNLAGIAVLFYSPDLEKIVAKIKLYVADKELQKACKYLDKYIIDVKRGHIFEFINYIATHYAAAIKNIYDSLTIKERDIITAEINSYHGSGRSLLITAEKINLLVVMLEEYNLAPIEITQDDMNQIVVMLVDLQAGQSNLADNSIPMGFTYR